MSRASSTLGEPCLQAIGRHHEPAHDGASLRYERYRSERTTLLRMLRPLQEAAIA